MPGVCDNFLPKPSFSEDNPYWRSPKNSPHPRLLPRLTGQDFLYASTWEIWRRFDTRGAYCVRDAVVRTVKVNWFISLHNQIKLLNLKEIKENEKAV